MSHTQITSLLLGFILIFQRASSSQFHGIPPGYCPGWNFTRSEHDIVFDTVSSIGFPFRRSTSNFLYKLLSKSMEFFWQWANILDTLASQRTETAGSVRLQVDSPTSWFAYTHANRFAYMIWRIVSVIRCPCITFNSVRRRIYMWRPRGVRQLLTNLQTGSSPFLLLLFLHPVL